MIDDNYAPYAPGASTSQTSINARRPYDPGILGQNIFLTSNQTANYHSLQVSVNRQMSHNLMLNGFYVWSHALQSSNESAIGQMTAQDFANLWEERGPMDIDRRNVANISGIWNIDYYRGSNFLVKHLANGWTISPIFYLQSGPPFEIVTGSNKNFDSSNHNRPKYGSGRQSVPGSASQPSSCRSRVVQHCRLYSQTDRACPAASVPEAQTEIRHVTPCVGRDTECVIWGSFATSTFGEGLTFQLRGEATNVFNMVSLNNPTANLASSLNGKISAAASMRIIQVGGRFTF